MTAYDKVYIASIMRIQDKWFLTIRDDFGLFFVLMPGKEMKGGWFDVR